jgi:hypothetical protein
VIFIDSNIPMYLIGSDHPNKSRARLLLERSIADGESLVTDVEVIQEILHRYVAINRRDAIQPAVTALLAVVDETYPIELEDVSRAASIVGAGGLGARDALHLAVMQHRGVSRIMTFDRVFDEIPGILRLGG